ncbi:hypothetical protein [Massilia sp. Se16.2.3]|uniref:hypothetical protein n=1 Tax=Massilia sp. Se16.2.3 TaxID=2709303 RepID=UPI0016016CA1|nr:hypothetical protein [Massilia sp. Se16.2.3]QNB00908.1 hypothetical protein G4G31_22305 [Massilia sp. Se16.2.3]
MRTTMYASTPLVLMLALTPMPSPAAPEPEPVRVFVNAARDSEWHSYRHAYKAARFFEAYTRTRPLIQAHMQIRPLRPDLPLTGLRIELAGETTKIDIPVDDMGRAVLPMLKAAYDEDAVLRLNRQKGHYTFSGRYSIRERDDGVYRGADLRAACEQLLSAQRESGYRFRLLGKKCAGVKFVYKLADATPQVLHRDAAGAERLLPVVEAQPFENNTMGLYKVAVYRFADWPADGSVVTQTRALAIGTLYD